MICQNVDILANSLPIITDLGSKFKSLSYGK